MRPRLVLLPLLVLAVGGGLALLQRRGAAPPAAVPVEDPGAPGHGRRPPGPGGEWYAQPVHVETLPRTVSVPARLITPEPVPLFMDIHAPFTEVMVREGDAVKAGDLLARTATESIERSLAEAVKTGDGEKAERLRKVLAGAELRAPAEGLVYRLDAVLGEMPPPPNSRGPRPTAVLFDWRKMVFEGTAPGEVAALAGTDALVLVRIDDGMAVRAGFTSIGEPSADGGVPLRAVPLEPPATAPEPGSKGEILLVSGTREGLVVPDGALGMEGGRPVVYEVSLTEELTPRPVGIGGRVRKGFVEVTGIDGGISVAVFGKPRPR